MKGLLGDRDMRQGLESSKALHSQLWLMPQRGWSQQGPLASPSLCSLFHDLPSLAAQGLQEEEQDRGCTALSDLEI